MPKERGLKDIVTNSIVLLNNVIRQIDTKEAALDEKDKRIFDEIVRAKQKGQNARASMLANELSQLRRTRKSIVGSKIVIEAIIQRLETAKEAGDFAANLAPAIAIVSSLKNHLASTMPEALRNLNESVQLTGYTPDIQLAGEEAERIIYEAQLAVENEAKTKFPEVPSEIRGQEAEEV